MNRAILLAVPLLFAGCVASATESQAGPEYAWSLVTTDSGVPMRDGAGALTWGRELLLIGGWNPIDPHNYSRVVSNDVWRSVDGETWTQIKPNTYTPDFVPDSDWPGRHTAGYAVHDGAIWILGGDTTSGWYQNDVWRSIDGVQWTRVTNNVPWAPRILHVAGSFDGYLWVMGGQTIHEPGPNLAPDAIYDDIWRSRDGANWEQVHVEGKHWSPRGMIDRLVVHDERMWILGGGTYPNPGQPDREYSNEVWSSADGAHWTFHGEAPWAPRQYHNAESWNGELWVMAGAGNYTNLPSDTWHSKDGKHWTRVENSPWIPRHAASLFARADALYLTAGMWSTDVWKVTEVEP